MGLCFWGWEDLYLHIAELCFKITGKHTKHSVQIYECKGDKKWLSLYVSSAVEAIFSNRRVFLCARTAAVNIRWRRHAR